MSSVSVSEATAAGREDQSSQIHQGSFASYVTGFVLAAVLTIAAFWLVMAHVFENRWVTILLVLGLAVVQIGVHIHYFLHLDTRSEEGWNMLAFIFAAVLVLIVLGASIWAIYQENQNMMPRVQALQAVTSAGATTMPSMPTAPSMPSMPEK
ncbi:MAG TPA: cytochrome o ubiquinol oxidase subunit IV [Castellaniella sp.]|uniref:cytochrome o ubiquinol oxidase subunit IV n=1 Tax=Castellaniella sp. TaxID=1955812 RepID=UPI002F1EC6E5